jgi:hypothetical protein
MPAEVLLPLRPANQQAALALVHAGATAHATERFKALFNVRWLALGGIQDQLGWSSSFSRQASNPPSSSITG